MKCHVKCWGWLISALLLFGVSGCGSPKFDVTGKVTYNGAALNKSDGVIVFIGSNGQQITATISPDGSYSCPGVAAGMNKVVVYYPNPKAKREKTSKMKPGETPPPSPPLYLTPEKYATADTTPLTTTIDKPSVFDVELNGPKIP